MNPEQKRRLREWWGWIDDDDSSYWGGPGTIELETATTSVMFELITEGGPNAVTVMDVDHYVWSYHWYEWPNEHHDSYVWSSRKVVL